MKAYRLTQSADRHLQEIWRYSKDHWGRARADAYLQELEAALDKALARPSLLRSRPELGVGVYALRAASQMIYALIADDVLIVIAVLHQRMDPRRHLKGTPS